MPHTESAYLIDPRTAETVDVLGPTVQFLTPPDGDDATPCVLRGTVPAGTIVPLHSHADPETFIVIAGEMSGLVHAGEDVEWVRIRPGDIFHIPGGAKHAFRNDAPEAAVMTIVTTARIARFFREVATMSEPPTPEELERFAATSERYGYWNATPEENAAIGLDLAAAFGD